RAEIAPHRTALLEAISGHRQAARIAEDFHLVAQIVLAALEPRAACEKRIPLRLGEGRFESGANDLPVSRIAGKLVGGGVGSRNRRLHVLLPPAHNREFENEKLLVG